MGCSLFHLTTANVVHRYPVYLELEDRSLHPLAGVAGFEPTKCWNQNPVPYRLATPLIEKELPVVVYLKLIFTQFHIKSKFMFNSV